MFKHLLPTITMAPLALLAMPLFAQNPVAVENPADIAKALGVQKPFVLGASCLNRLGPNNVCSAGFTVPAGVRLVVKTIVYRCTYPSTMALTQFAIAHTISGSLFEMFLDIPPSRFLESSPFPTGVTAQTLPVETYADPATQVSYVVRLSGTAPANQFSCGLSLIGQEVAVP